MAEVLALLSVDDDLPIAMAVKVEGRDVEFLGKQKSGDESKHLIIIAVQVRFPLPARSIDA